MQKRRTIKPPQKTKTGNLKKQQFRITKAKFFAEINPHYFVPTMCPLAELNFLKALRRDQLWKAKLRKTVNGKTTYSTILVKSVGEIAAFEPSTGNIYWIFERMPQKDAERVLQEWSNVCCYLVRTFRKDFFGGKKFLQELAQKMKKTKS